MAEPVGITITGDAGDVFREHFNIQSVEQARDAVKNLDALWNTPNPWSHRSDLRDIFDEAGKSVQRRFETGVYKPQDKAQPSDHFSTGNRIASRQDGSFKAVSSTPDVCKTPMGSSTPPVPYQVVSDLSGSSGIVPSVRFNGKPAYVLDQSVVPTCTGDEAGSADGVRSGTVGGETKPTKGSTTVRAGGHPVIRDGDPCTMNSGNCTGTYVTAPAPGSSVDASGNVVGDANPPPEKGVMHQVGGFFKGAGGAVWDMGKGLVGLGVGAAKLSPVSQAAEGLSDLTGLYDYHGYSQTLDSAGKTAQAIYDHPGAIVDGITKPYMEAWSQGNYGEALGRGAVDIGGLFVGGVGAAGKVGEAGNVAGKLGEAANVGGKIGETANVAGKVGEASNAAGKMGETADAAGAAGRTGDAANAAKAADTAGESQLGRGAIGDDATTVGTKATGDAAGTKAPVVPKSEFDKLADISGDGIRVKPSGGAWKYPPNWSSWIKKGGKIVTHEDGSVTYIRKDGVQVTYNKEGFPDFSPHATESVKIDDMQFNHTSDFRKANEKIGLTGSDPPDGFTWHHVEDGKTMQLVPQSIHNVAEGGFPHAGGVSVGGGG
ncbi:PAAR-like domain-containing protein [Burkholderia contaminans]|uniref:PAAR-like domain-containing protein n=1 Tax=Burkholderia contaminans TaxID=488447 RepID=UPI00158C9B9E|nr:PAAR-like domain-containing protein [Burkholderia contaminans]